MGKIVVCYYFLFGYVTFDTNGFRLPVFVCRRLAVGLHV